METFNIFDEVKQGQFFKFEKVGDQVQGTYIGKSKAKGKFGDQILYIIQDKAGNVWNIPFGLTKTIIHERMKDVSFGQVIGFKFDETRPNDKGNDAKIIRVYADARFIDHEWLKNQKSLGKEAGAETEEEPANDYQENEIDAKSIFDQPEGFQAPESAEAAGGGEMIPKETPKEEAPKEDEPVKHANEAVEAIRTLARTKGLTNDSMSLLEADDVIEKYTGLQLIEENLTKIIIKLTGYVSK